MNRICFAMCVATAVAGLVLPCSAGEANPEPPLESAESLVGRIVQAVQGGEHFPAHDYAKLAGREDVAQEMERVFPELTPEQQKKLLGYLPSIGARKGCHRWFFSVGMTRLLVKAASSGKSYDVRDSAGTRLVRYVPDSYLRIHAATIVDAAGSGALNRESLLGKTGSHEAREFIKQSGRDSTWARLALAKLGDTSISLEFVEAFRNETNVMKKARMAGQLGYIGDAACVYALAREMRSPLIHLEKSGVASDGDCRGSERSVSRGACVLALR